MTANYFSFFSVVMFILGGAFSHTSFLEIFETSTCGLS